MREVRPDVVIILFLITGFCGVCRAENSACDLLYKQILQPGFDDAGAGRHTAECYENTANDDSKDEATRAEAYYRIGIARYFVAASTGDIHEMEMSRDALQKAVDMAPEHAAARDQLMKAEGWINP